MRRTICALAAALALAGCTSTTGGTGSPSTTSSTPVEPLPPDQVVLEVDWGVGFVTYDMYLADSSEIVIYGDGRTYSLGETEGFDPAPLLLGQLDPIDVAELVAEVESSGLISDSVDYGDPMVTDAGTVMVSVDGRKGYSSVGVYALGVSDESLPKSQRKKREALSELIDTIEAAVPDSGPVTPNRVDVVGFKADSEDGLPAWPGPAPASFMTPQGTSSTSCGVLEGPDAATVYQASLINEHDRAWLVDGAPTGLVVRPLLPGREACQHID